MNVSSDQALGPAVIFSIREPILLFGMFVKMVLIFYRVKISFDWLKAKHVHFLNAVSLSEVYCFVSVLSRAIHTSNM